jgi:hypothetical protein
MKLKVTTVTASIPGNLKDKIKKLIEELRGVVIQESNSSRKKAVLKELEEAFSEAKEIKNGKKQGLTLHQVLSV